MACNFKIDVVVAKSGGEACSLYRECEFREVKSIMRRGCYIHNIFKRQKREEEVKCG